jgi:thiamine-monophosphate kinase
VPLPEKTLIAHLRRAARATRPSPEVKAGIGDDCAVLRIPSRWEALVTTDFSLERTHFRREWHPPESVGHRCLARGLSDIAAMGGEPIAAFLSLALPAKLPQSWVDGFLSGFLRLAGRAGVTLAGGDVAQSPAGVLADIVVLGKVPAGKALRRSGAREGDSIYITGELGGSAAILDKLRRSNSRPAKVSRTGRHHFPVPQLEVGRWLREHGLASAAIDVSDGLSTDLAHICEESKVGAVVYANNLPIARGSNLQLALHGGEDYELLFTARPRKPVPASIAGVRVSRIGEIMPGKRLWLADTGGRRQALQAQGWEHFSK